MRSRRSGNWSCGWTIPKQEQFVPEKTNLEKCEPAPTVKPYVPSKDRYGRVINPFEWTPRFEAPSKGSFARMAVRMCNVALDDWDKEYPHLDRYFGMEVIKHNWDRGIRRPDELICLEHYTNEFADSL